MVEGCREHFSTGQTGEGEKKMELGKNKSDGGVNARDIASDGASRE